MTGSHYFRFSFLFLLLFLATGPVKAAAQNSLQSFDLAGMYQASLKEKVTGWYPLADYVVFIADLKREDRSISVRDMRAKAMLKVGELMRSWSVSECGRVECDLGRWPERSRKIMQNYLEKQIQTPSFGQFNGHLLENAPQGQRFRYAFAVSKKELVRFCEGVKQIVTDPAALFSSILDGALKEENFQLVSILLWDAGLPHLASRAVQESLKDQLCMVNYALLPNPLEQRNALQMLFDGRLEKSSSSLKKLPGSPEILALMAEKQDESEPEKSFSFLALSLPAAGQRRTEILKKMEELSGTKIILPAVDSDSGMVDMSVSTFGNIRFGDAVPAYDDAYLRQAITLFNERGDKGQIRQLLEQAADRVPANPKVWDYLGAMLKADKIWDGGVAVYLQLLQLRPFDSEALAHLAQCYNNIGNKKGARTIADFIYYGRRIEDNKTVNRIIQEIRR
ncbi:hypothetical protein [Maridesulfovibrio hydrothermalis]|uniref:Tetratricopeptide repeat protein n=1 Tax=Maridesulfovibrio hydrothermalis AM13 = DSM 14728 TaxID=1121451 RepID=L0R947_9BACT|nr:hypothetical protein [Maridesulfovibrio hydrothermalis]CCO23283.1 exported protein of unknown function [Maridesulfovibrio hydrothermalis AM13 = DSM 14728]